MKELHCQGVGFDCEKVIRAEYEEEILRQAAEHVGKDHGMTEITPETARNVASKIRTTCMGSSPGHSARTLSASAAAVCLAIALVSCGDEPAGPSNPGPLELPATWNLDDGLDGWTLSSRTTGDGGGAAAHDGSEGWVVLSGSGEPGTADAWMSRQIQLPEADPVDPSGELRIDARVIADCALGQDRDSAIRISVTDEHGATSIISDWSQVTTYERPASAAGSGGSIEAFAGQEVTITIEQDDEGEQEEADEPESVCVDVIEIFLD